MEAFGRLKLVDDLLSGEASGPASAGQAAGGRSPAGSVGFSAAQQRPRTGKGSRGSRPRLFKKGECQADGCPADLTGLPRYHQRNHVCLHHKTADSFLKQGAEVRFCQRCGVAHLLAEFDGLKKSCRKQLAVHNSRRRRGASALAAAGAAAAAAVPTPVQQPQQQQQQRREQPQQQPAGALLLQAVPHPVLLDQNEGPAALADWDASLDASPEASVGSAALSEQSGSWLLDEDTSSSDLGGGGGAGSIPLPDPAALLWPDDQQQQQQLMHQPLGVSGSGLGAGLPLRAAACAGPAHERVCCGAACGACGGCCSAAAEPAAALGGADAAAAARTAAGGAGGVGSAPFPAGEPSGSHTSASHEDDSTDGDSGAVSAPPGAVAAAALGQLQQHNAALYSVFVQQQLLAAQTLLATAGLVLSQRLPAVQALPVC